MINLIAKGLNLDTAAAIRMLAADLGLQPDTRRDRREIRRQIRENQLQQATVSAWEEDFLWVFLKLAAIAQALNALLQTYEDYFCHSAAVHWRPIIEDLLDDLTAANQETQVAAWRYARRLLPWLRK